MAQVAMIAGLGMMVCCSSSVAALMMGGGEEDTPALAATTPTGPSAPVIDPDGNMLAGFSRNGIVGSGKQAGTSPSECRALAKKNGFVGVGFRNDTHPNAEYKNTCFFYYNTDSAFTGDEADTVHFTGCTDPSKEWPNCGSGSALPGHSRNQIIGSDKTAGTSLDDCRAKAKELGHIGTGFRNETHSDASYRNTCFYYTGIDSGFGGDTNDFVHTTGCTDATKSWPNC
jgi:hypothetical protein